MADVHLVVTRECENPHGDLIEAGICFVYLIRLFSFVGPANRVSSVAVPVVLVPAQTELAGCVGICHAVSVHVNVTYRPMLRVEKNSTVRWRPGRRLRRNCSECKIARPMCTKGDGCMLHVWRRSWRPPQPKTRCTPTPPYTRLDEEQEATCVGLAQR
ncbi:hypothetical protein BU26DRAFT_108354 [Trematosphaeria pertusa]|uniref:Uncharacterized protein n=1 Tax=Trematosphaeria pertusa TaxID=390896 RepID=A0A6A6I1K2_9PLEO|nr:uncharacterized protein BU26DRAFT_108354 [Trematosphaeria pertusa]KAF2243743.1 hypothetical protein BU26DRAFT_108354 [Trematosphaeria pertusa]